jgi:hypothetical protein
MTTENGSAPTRNKGGRPRKTVDVKLDEQFTVTQYAPEEGAKHLDLPVEDPLAPTTIVPDGIPVAGVWFAEPAEVGGRPEHSVLPGIRVEHATYRIGYVVSAGVVEIRGIGARDKKPFRVWIPLANVKCMARLA